MEPFVIKDRPESEHQAVIFIRAEVHRVLQTGELSGDPVSRVEEFPVRIVGHDRDTCLCRLNDFLAGVKESLR